VVGKGSPLLAALVDRGDFNQHDINLEITTQVDNILSREKVNDLIPGCTHYPIVEETYLRVLLRSCTLLNPPPRRDDDDVVVVRNRNGPYRRTT